MTTNTPSDFLVIGNSNGGRHAMRCLLSMLLFATQSTVVLSDIDPGADFGGYMQEMDRMEREDRAYEAKLRSHEEWRQNTWGGYAVRKIQGLAYHLKPFFLAVQDALHESSGGSSDYWNANANANIHSSVTRVLTYVGVRMFLILVLLAVFYVGAKVMELVVGSDYEVVEEIVVVHEHGTEEEAARARAATTRGKKVKSS
mmetsp:Transcript_26281/g.72214  ORF Transcript_26281/g.72214 Transcript_26281/m.72214 type:complete len:200 (-) Transcript_26281:732-1331(-)